jgi:arylsulfatase A-like enzyme
MADVYVRQATRFIEQSRGQPFFLYFSTHDIHVPRIAHARFAGKNPMGPRGDVILQLDWTVGTLLDLLDRLNLTRDTLVLFSSDNGPVVDDGYKDQAKEKIGDHRPAGPWRGGKYSIFEGGTRVPFLVRWPARVKPGVSDALLCQVDLPATFAALTGQKSALPSGPDSQNHLAALLGEARTGRTTLIEHSGGLAVRQGAWKFVPKRPGVKRTQFTDTETGNHPEFQLYNLASDPGETNNLALTQPDKVKELLALLEAEKAKGFPKPANERPNAKAPAKE